MAEAFLPLHQLDVSRKKSSQWAEGNVSAFRGVTKTSHHEKQWEDADIGRGVSLSSQLCAPTKLMLAHKMPQMMFPTCRNAWLCPHCPWPWQSRREQGSCFSGVCSCIPRLGGAEFWGPGAVLVGSGQCCPPSQGLLAPSLSHLPGRGTPSPLG